METALKKTYISVTPRSEVVYHGICHESLVFSRYTHGISILHGNYSCQGNQSDIRVAHDGKIGCNIVEYTTAFPYSDWLYFLCHCINVLIIWLAP